MHLGKGNKHVFKMNLFVLKEPFKHCNRRPQCPIIARRILLPFVILCYSMRRVEHNLEQLLLPGSRGTGSY